MLIKLLLHVMVQEVQLRGHHPAELYTKVVKILIVGVLKHLIQKHFHQPLRLEQLRYQIVLVIKIRVQLMCMLIKRHHQFQFRVRL